jgi:radical SAM protein with 4Fe4S-binding SPASM domain
MNYPVLVKIKKIKRQPDISYIFIQDGVITRKSPVNESAVSILELCSGKNSIDDIVKTLSNKYSETLEKVEKLVTDFLEYSRQLGVLTLVKEPKEVENVVEILGSNNQWIPDTILMELTYDCPLNCVHCYLDSRKPIYMNFDFLMKIIGELKNIGIDNVQLTGGEPLIYPKIEEVINYLCNNGFTVAITTSGFLQPDKLTNLLPAFEKMSKTNGIVQVSLDGFEANHNYIRRNPGGFKKTINFIEKVIEQKVQLHVATVVTEDSFEELEDLSTFLKNKGTKVHRIGSLTERGRAKSFDKKSGVEFVEKLITRIMELKQTLGDTNFKIQDLDEVKDHQNQLFYKNCGAGARFYRISPDFKLYPCSLIDSPIGEVTVDSLFDLFQESPQKYTKITAPGKNSCGNCRLFVKCEGCLAEGLLNKDKVKNCLWYNNIFRMKKTLISDGG